MMDLEVNNIYIEMKMNPLYEIYHTFVNSIYIPPLSNQSYAFAIHSRIYPIKVPPKHTNNNVGYLLNVSTNNGFYGMF